MKFRKDTDGYLLTREWVADNGYIYADVWGQLIGEEVGMTYELEYVGSDYSK